MFVNNPNFDESNIDNLYHFGMSTLTHDFPKLFGDVKVSRIDFPGICELKVSRFQFVLCGGSAKRMELLATMLLKELNLSESPAAVNLCLSDRYVMYKAGPVLCVNVSDSGQGIVCFSDKRAFQHGMGMPSMSIMLHEMFKLLRHAGCKDVLFFRIGTSGGIGK